MRAVPIGISRRQSFMPQAQDSAAALGNVGVEAVATVTLILWVEATCGPLLVPYFEAGEGGVGFRVALDHTGPAFAGRPVEVHAEVTAVAGRKVTFRVRVEQDGRTVMAGEHVRAIIDLGRLLAGKARQRERPELTPITFWFDVHSPWSYLASFRIGDIARRHNAPLLWRPLHLPNLMDRVDGMRPLEQNPARVAWYEQDVRDRMEQAGLAYDPHPDYPLRPSRAQRACVYAAQQGCAEAFLQAVMRGYWSQHVDISDLAVLQAMADGVGLGPRTMAEVVEDAAIKAAVATNTEEAAAGGVFGVPSMVYADKLFFGCDHLDLLEAALARDAAS
jgi:2-hydroxychromene-2-carboxylate isomerase/predicted thioesterase